MNRIDLVGQVAVVTGGAQGLGLAIAKEIASRHKAEIYAKSDADGTCFTVFFSWQLNPS